MSTYQACHCWIQLYLYCKFIRRTTVGWKYNYHLVISRIIWKEFVVKWAPYACIFTLRNKTKNIVQNIYRSRTLEVFSNSIVDCCLATCCLKCSCISHFVWCSCLRAAFNLSIRILRSLISATWEDSIVWAKQKLNWAKSAIIMTILMPRISP